MKFHDEVKNGPRTKCSGSGGDPVQVADPTSRICLRKDFLDKFSDEILDRSGEA